MGRAATFTTGSHARSGAAAASEMQTARAAPLRPVDLGATGYRRIADLAGGARVVSLGESIHLTREMPVIRLEIVRRLHQDKRFRVLALEGSLIESWTAQEHAGRPRDGL